VKENRDMLRRRLAVFVLAAACVASLTAAVPASAASADRPDGRLSLADRRTLAGYAADTWRSFVMLVDPASGLPSDNVSADGTRAAYTSPTNVATYLWSTLAARDLGIIGRSEARSRIGRTLAALAKLERHEPSGMFFNWYDPATGAKLTTWPVDGSPVHPFLSSVDNGWLAAALLMVERAEPRHARAAAALRQPMDFGFYHDPVVGQLRGGFWLAPPGSTCTVTGNYRGRGDDVLYTCHHYGTLNTEPRIASYLGIAFGQVPENHYFKMFRTFPDTCDWSWQETKPGGETRNHLGIDVFEGHYTYRGMRIVPSWGGSMFEALMVTLLVPEERWAPRSWGVNHPLYVRAQIEHGMEEAGYGYWGFSPANNPDGGYREYGVDAIGLNPDGYTSNQERTLVDHGFGDCRPGQPDPQPGAYTNGVVTPHAAFLALRWAPDAALDNLAKLRRDFDAYGKGGFYDSINIDSGQASRFYLALDQGMIMAAIGNALRGDNLRRYFSAGPIEREIRPLIAQEAFTAGDS
jgi:Putative glucoamylase/Protein of unknown function (DUF3131)